MIGGQLGLDQFVSHSSGVLFYAQFIIRPNLEQKVQKVISEHCWLQISTEQSHPTIMQIYTTAQNLDN